MMEVKSGPKDLEIRRKSCDEELAEIIETLTVLQFVKSLGFLFEYFFSLEHEKSNDDQKENEKFKFFCNGFFASPLG